MNYTSRPAQAFRHPEITRIEDFVVPDGDFRFAALDVETANSDQGSICQLGVAFVGRDGRIQTICTLVDPQDRFSSSNIGVHGITPDMVRGAPQFPEVLATIQARLGSIPVIQHSSFDSIAIRKACDRWSLPEPGWSWFDSVQIARRAWPEFVGNGGHGLKHLKRALEIDFEHHDAREDAYAAAIVVLRAETLAGAPFQKILNARAPVGQSRVAKTPTPPVQKPEKVFPVPEGDELRLCLGNLADLIGFLEEQKPLSKTEIEALCERRRTSVAAGGFDTIYTGIPSFIRNNPADAERQIKAIEHDLRAQIAVVNECCRGYFKSGDIPAPHYPWRVVILLSKAGCRKEETNFLAAWCRHFPEGNGATYIKLVERARKRGLPV